MTLIAALGLSWLTLLVGFVAGAWWSGRARPAITRVRIDRFPRHIRVPDGRLIHVAYDGYTRRDAVDAVIEASRP